MSWVQASLLARGLSRGWGSICRTALSGAPFAQVTTGWVFMDAGGKAGAFIAPLQDQATEAEGTPWPAYLGDGPCVSYFAIAVLKYRDQKQFTLERVCLVYSSRG